MNILTVIVVSMCIAIGWFRGLASSVMADIPRYTITQAEAKSLIYKRFPLAHINLKDPEYTCTDKNSFLAAVMLALSNAKPWRKHIDDCENKAFRCWVNLSDVAGISAQFYAEGTNDKGKPHGFILAIIREGDQFVLHLLESQSGMLDPKNYRVTSVSHAYRSAPYIDSVNEIDDTDMEVTG